MNVLFIQLVKEYKSTNINEANKQKDRSIVFQFQWDSRCKFLPFWRKKTKFFMRLLHTQKRPLNLLYDKIWVENNDNSPLFPLIFNCVLRSPLIIIVLVSNFFRCNVIINLSLINISYPSWTICKKTYLSIIFFK